jgi:hypothetical protein
VLSRPIYPRVSNEIDLDEQKAGHIEQLRIFLLRDAVLDTIGWHQLYIGMVEEGATWDDDRKILIKYGIRRSCRKKCLSGPFFKRSEVYAS